VDTSDFVRKSTGVVKRWRDVAQRAVTDKGIIPVIESQANISKVNISASLNHPKSFKAIMSNCLELVDSFKLVVNTDS